MYERFTDNARAVMQIANQEAHCFSHEYIGVEHVVLALLKQGTCRAYDIIRNLGHEPAKIRLEISKLIPSGPSKVAAGKFPQTPRTKKALEHAMEEARELHHNYVGTEHLLLGLLREEHAVIDVLTSRFEVTAERVRVVLRGANFTARRQVVREFTGDENTMFFITPPSGPEIADPQDILWEELLALRSKVVISQVTILGHKKIQTP